VRYGVAVWNWVEPGQSLSALVRELAGMGFDVMSFLPGQLLSLSQAQARALLAVLDGYRLPATVHGTCDLEPDMIEHTVTLLGRRLLAFTLDPLQRTDSRGTLYAVNAMVALLQTIRDSTRGTRVRFGIEDFPLDSLALDYYREELEPVLESPRFGILLDVGHMNLRMGQEDYFATDVGDYISRLPLPIVEVHVHDNGGERDSHEPLGAGDIPFPAVAGALMAVGFDGVSTIEIEPSFHGSTPAASKSHLRRTFEVWRGMLETRRSG
jgi:sugar phosphate isomerase/epimerase